jgi:hypothetical protein
MITHAPDNHNVKFILRESKNWSNSLKITEQLTENKRDSQEPSLRQYTWKCMGTECKGTHWMNIYSPKTGL